MTVRAARVQSGALALVSVSEELRRADGGGERPHVSPDDVSCRSAHAIDIARPNASASSGGADSVCAMRKAEGKPSLANRARCVCVRVRSRALALLNESLVRGRRTTTRSCRVRVCAACESGARAARRRSIWCDMRSEYAGREP